MSDQYDLLQTALTFSFAASRAENVWGSKAAITDFFDKALKDGGTCCVIYSGSQPQQGASPTSIQVTGFLQKVGTKLLGGDWRIAWGPCVFADPLPASSAPSCLANGMFVAHSTSCDTYIVAVSPTNFASLQYVFLQMDLDDDPLHMVDFPVNTSHSILLHSGNHTDRTQLTGGTALGIFNHCKMQDDDHVDIAAYLARAPKTAATKLIFAGHSLGGALAPSLALQLYDGLKNAGWTPANIMVLATAGATPGNGRFKDEWAGKFSPRPVDSPDKGNGLVHFNMLHWNRWDGVPYAFANLFGQGENDWNRHEPAKDSDVVECPLGTCVGHNNVTENNLSLDRQHNALQCELTKLPNTRFTGRWPVHYWGSDGSKQRYQGPPASPMTSEGFMTAKGMAHMGQYLDIAGIDPWDIPPPVGYNG